MVVDFDKHNSSKDRPRGNFVFAAKPDSSSHLLDLHLYKWPRFLECSSLDTT